MTQLTLSLESSTPPPREKRRLDITLERLDAMQDALTDAERADLGREKWWSIVVIVSRVRSMELAEEDVLGRPVHGLADAYDRVVQPGGSAVEAILTTFIAVYATAAEPAP